MKPSFSCSKAAEELGVSTATVRNWLRSDEAGDGSLEALQRLAEKRLKCRANKRNLRGRRSLSKRIRDPFLRENAERVLDFFWEKMAGFPQTELLRDGILFCLARHFCGACGRKDAGIVRELAAWETELEERVRETAKEAQKETAKKTELCAWERLLAETDGFLRVHWQYTGDADRLGILFREMTQAGMLAERGAFDTPEHVARDAVERLAEMMKAEETPSKNGEKTWTFLDPACGTGTFLREIRRRFQVPLSALFGMDLDPTAVRIARLVLLWEVPDSTEMPYIVCRDGLSTELPEGMPTAFAAIAANPPWGAKKTRPSPEMRRSPERKTLGKYETFTQFLLRSWELLRPGGTAVFLLPEAFLNIRTHAPIRRFLLENAQIEEAVSIGKAFEGVFTPAVRLVFRKPALTGAVPQVSQETETLHFHAETQGFPQERFLQLPDCIISPTASSETFRIVEKMYAVPHETLAGHAEWGLGIVTGNNARWVAEEPKSDAWEPILCGPDIEPFRIREPQKWIHFRPECFQQTLPKERFRVPEKIVYRFITSRPAFALDTQQRLTLNSANFLVPSIPGLSTLAILAFLNSEAFRFLFVQQFFTHKVLRGDLERLPFPKISKKFSQNLEILAGDVFSGKEVCAKMEEQIFLTFNLTRTEIQFIRRSLKK
ncbi:MAG: hypothetical protein E7029_07135 [Planctomycetaceae bacterium]|nr:hypothetical protein [Planctomycetaceae bacterium]